MKILSLVQENFASYQVLKSFTFFSFVMKKKKKKPHTTESKQSSRSGLQRLQSLGMLSSEETVFCVHSRLSSLAFGHGLNCNHRNGAHFIG